MNPIVRAKGLRSTALASALSMALTLSFACSALNAAPAADTNATDTKTADKKAADKKATDKKTTDKKSADKKTPDKKTSDKKMAIRRRRTRSQRRLPRKPERPRTPSTKHRRRFPAGRAPCGSSCHTAAGHNRSGQRIGLAVAAATGRKPRPARAPARDRADAGEEAGRAGRGRRDLLDIAGRSRTRSRTSST